MNGHVFSANQFIRKFLRQGAVGISLAGAGFAQELHNFCHASAAGIILLWMRGQGDSQKQQNQCSKMFHAEIMRKFELTGQY